MMLDSTARPNASARGVNVSTVAIIIGIAIMLSACQLLLPTDTGTRSATTNSMIEQPGFLLWTGFELEPRKAPRGRTSRRGGGPGGGGGGGAGQFAPTVPLGKRWQTILLQRDLTDSALFAGIVLDCRSSTTTSRIMSTFKVGRGQSSSEVKC